MSNIDDYEALKKYCHNLIETAGLSSYRLISEQGNVGRLSLFEPVAPTRSELPLEDTIFKLLLPNISEVQTLRQQLEAQQRQNRRERDRRLEAEKKIEILQQEIETLRNTPRSPSPAKILGSAPDAAIHQLPQEQNSNPNFSTKVENLLPKSLHLSALLGDAFVPLMPEAQPDPIVPQTSSSSQPTIDMVPHAPQPVKYASGGSRAPRGATILSTLQSFATHPWLQPTFTPVSCNLTLFVWGSGLKSPIRYEKLGTFTRESPPLPYVPILEYDHGSASIRCLAMLYPKCLLTPAQLQYETATHVPLPRSASPTFWCAWTQHPLLNERLNDGIAVRDQLFNGTAFFITFHNGRYSELLRKYFNYASTRSAPRETEIYLPGSLSELEFDIFDEAAGTNLRVRVPLAALRDDKYVPPFFSIKAAEILLLEMAKPTFLQQFGRSSKGLVRPRAPEEQQPTGPLPENSVDTYDYDNYGDEDHYVEGDNEGMRERPTKMPKLSN